jgi:hypothetical protein
MSAGSTCAILARCLTTRSSPPRVDGSCWRSLGGDIGYELGRPPDAAVGKPGGDNAAASVGLFSKYWRLLTAPTSREGQNDLADKSFLGKSISYVYRCQRNIAAAGIALAKKPRITGIMQAIR